MGEVLRVLFVCTGNVFRSMSAEYCCNAYCKEKNLKNILASSAGISANPQPIRSETLTALKNNGVRVRKHIQRKLTKKMLQDADVVIAMAKNHQEYIYKTFHLRVHLFSEFAKNGKKSIPDYPSRNGLTSSNKTLLKYHAEKTVSLIYDAIPTVYETIRRNYLLFTEFVNGTSSHLNNFKRPPFLYESKHTVAFMALSIPQKEDGHILVIPKKRFARLEDIPKNILHDIMDSIAIIGKSLLLTHEGYNVVLNNGESAEQSIFHTHFHIIPRNKNDDIRMKVWKEKRYTEKTFIRLNKEYRKNIRKVLSED